MLRSQYYDELKQLAREVRGEYGLDSPRVLRSDLRRIYRDQGIRIDLWNHNFKRLRGAYFSIDDPGQTASPLLHRRSPMRSEKVESESC
jgi:hypothetical protein